MSPLRPSNAWHLRIPVTLQGCFRSTLNVWTACRDGLLSLLSKQRLGWEVFHLLCRCPYKWSLAPGRMAESYPGGTPRVMAVRDERLRITGPPPPLNQKGSMHSAWTVYAPPVSSRIRSSSEQISLRVKVESCSLPFQSI